MSEFTKAPWSIVDGSESGHCCFEKTIIDVDGENVCELWSDHASLIEVAPEMYEKLDELQRLLADEYLQTSLDIRKLLAKARGEL